MVFCVNINRYERGKKVVCYMFKGYVVEKKYNIYMSKNLHKIGLENLKYGMYINSRY